MNGETDGAQIIPLSKTGKAVETVARDAVMAAGEVLSKRWHELQTGAVSRELQIVKKGRNNLVTDVDHEAESAAKKVLSAEYPDFSMLAEESGNVPGEEEFIWILDPLDGTRNFASGVPHFAVNLALVTHQKPVLGMTFDPIRREFFHAILGRGVHLNGKRISVSETEKLEDSVLGFDMGYVDSQGTELLMMLNGLWPRMQTIRINGSAALGLAYVAAGRYELYAHHHLSPWDIAAGILMVEESGGTATNLQGGTVDIVQGTVIAGNPSVHKEFLLATADSPWRKIL